MKEFFARLNPTERRFVVGVAVAFFLVGNIVWVWPHFSDWGETRTAMGTWRNKLVMFEAGAGEVPRLRAEIEKIQKGGEPVPAEDEAVYFFKLIRNQATASGVSIISQGSSHQTGTNQFFVEQNQTITTQSGEKQLVDFLYHLGAGQSLIRVKVLSVQPDAPHQQLTARITLIASYQRKTPVATTAAKAAPTAPKPTNPVPTGATPKSSTSNPLAPKPGMPLPGGRTSATNKLNPLTTKKQ